MNIPVRQAPSLITHFVCSHCAAAATPHARSLHTSAYLRLRTRLIRDRLPFRSQSTMEEDRQALIPEKGQILWEMPKAPWATAIPSKRDPARLLPQSIAHRGYKALWPENTMGAFKAAADAGAHAIETDIHLSKDGVAVLCHDASLLRCFGVHKRVSDYDWDHLSTLQTLREPRQPMPRLQDLLQWLAEEDKLREDNDRLWVLLDIKLEDNAQDCLNAIAAAISQVPSSTPWDGRIVLGCWNASTLKAARKTLPSFPVVHIGLSLSYARHFLPLPNIGFNMAVHTLLRPYQGRRFMRDLYSSGRALYAWTINSEKWMRWCLRQNIPPHTPNSSRAIIDGVLTDDPGLFLQVCKRYEDELDGGATGDSRWSLFDAVDSFVDLLRRHVRFKLFFWYRKFVQGKLDDIDAAKLVTGTKRD